MNIYLTLQEFKDGRVMFRRWEQVPTLTTADWQTPSSGGSYQKQTMEAFMWLHNAGMPMAPEEIPSTTPFEVI